VFHPDLISDFSNLLQFPFPVAFENMDKNKSSFRHPEEFRRIFSISDEFKLVLDINHIYTNDSTLSIAREFYQKFGDRITEIHLSGYRTVHDPLYITKQTDILEAIQKPFPQIILEGIGHPNEIMREIAYVKSFLKI
jgi:uncharacterized protein (UPF0276 family)